MSMSKKDFIALADEIQEHNRIAAHPANADRTQQFNADQLETLATFCKRQNPNFMRGRWLGYIAGECGKNGGRR
jgi:hypothetical protein